MFELGGHINAGGRLIEYQHSAPPPAASVK